MGLNEEEKGDDGFRTRPARSPAAILFRLGNSPFVVNTWVINHDIIINYATKVGPEAGLEKLYAS